MPFISRSSVMKAPPKTEAPFGQIHNVRRKTFISLPFTGGLSAFAVILPHPFPLVIARENCPLADSFGLPFSAAVIDRYITLRDVLYVLHVFFFLM
jgi:hypothetical protein